MSVKSLSRVRLFATPWTVARQAPLSMGFFQALRLEWVAISFSMGSSQSRDRTRVSCIAGRRFIFWATREDPALPSRFFTTSAICKAHAILLVLSKYIYLWIRVSWVVLVINDQLPMQEMQETQIQSLGWEDPLKGEMATHSSILAWKIPWTEEPSRLQSMG